MVIFRFLSVETVAMVQELKATTIISFTECKNKIVLFLPKIIINNLTIAQLL